MEEVDFIPTINKIGKIWGLWKLVLKGRTVGKVNRACIKIMAKSCKIPQPILSN